MDAVLAYLNKLPLFVHIIMGVGAFNMVLSGLHAALASIKDQTATDLDNKADDAIVKVQSAIQKVLDVVGFNPEHK